MGFFSGSRKIIHAVNPIETGKPGARLIRDSVRELTRKNNTAVEPLSTMSRDDRLFIAGRFRRSGVIVAILGALLALISAWSGISQSSALIMVSSIIIMAGSFIMAYLKFWQADMIEHQRAIPLSSFTANLLHHKD